MAEKCFRELQTALKFKNKRERHAVLKYLASKECVYDTLRNLFLNLDKLNLTSNQKHKLYKYLKPIKTFRHGVKSKSAKQRAVLQVGGALPFLIPLALSALPSIIDLFKR